MVSSLDTSEMFSSYYNSPTTHHPPQVVNRACRQKKKILTSVLAFPDHLTVQMLLSRTSWEKKCSFLNINIFQEKEDANPGHIQRFQKSTRMEISQQKYDISE